MKIANMRLKQAAIAVIAAALPLAAAAADPVQALQQQIDALQKQLEQLRSQMQQQNQSTTSNQELAREVKALKKEVKSAGEWKDTNTLFHVTGYGDVGYTDAENKSSTFSPFSFNPVFHFQYKDLLLAEAEFSYKVDEKGETETELEYAAINLFLNDYMALSAGKLLSPIGQFRQNIHPSWINKLPSAPVGFGHGQAAPIAMVGVQLRGGVPLGDSDNRVNYALFVDNGPGLDIAGGEIEEIHTGGLGTDSDGKKVAGGRIGLFLPAYKLDLGLSGATGKVAGIAESGVTRDYDVVDADFTWRPGQFDFRGEYVSQKIGDAAASSAPEGGTWKAWYVQGAYRLGGKWEPVVRYGRYNTPHPDLDQKQWALGLNYLFTSSIIGKVAYEFNDGLDGKSSDDDRLLLQLTYGF